MDYSGYPPRWYHVIPYRFAIGPRWKLYPTVPAIFLFVNSNQTPSCSCVWATLKVCVILVMLFSQWLVLLLLRSIAIFFDFSRQNMTSVAALAGIPASTGTKVVYLAQWTACVVFKSYLGLPKRQRNFVTSVECIVFTCFYFSESLKAVFLCQKDREIVKSPAATNEYSHIYRNQFNTVRFSVALRSILHYYIGLPQILIYILRNTSSFYILLRHFKIIF